MAFGAMPVQARAYEQAQTVYPFHYEEMDELDMLNFYADRFPQPNIDAWEVFEGEFLRDPSSISESDRLRILAQVGVSTVQSVGLQGFDDNFDANPDEVIEIIVQFVTPPSEVLRHLPNTARARVNPYAEALAAHAAFDAQLGSIFVPFSMSSPAIEITGRLHTLFNGVFMRVSAGLAGQIAALPEVFVVTPVYEIFAMSTFAPPNTNDFMADSVDVLKVEYIHENFGFTGTGIKVAVIDTGIDYNHPRLVNNFAGGWDFVDNDDDPMETTFRDWQESGRPMYDNRGVRFMTNHGTHVAGTIVAIAPDVEIYAYRALGPHGSGSIMAGMASVERAYADNVHIINMSFGAAANRPFDPMAYLVNVASLNGVVMVTSAGNSGSLGSFSVGTPAVASLPITVGAASYGGFGGNGWAGAVTTGNPFEVSVLGWRAGDSFRDDTINDDIALNRDLNGFYTYVRVGGGTVADFAQAGDLTGRIAVIERGHGPLEDSLNRAIISGAGAVVYLNNEGNARMAGVIIQGERPQNHIPILTVTQNNAINFSSDTGRLRLNEFTLGLRANRTMARFSSQGPVSGTFHIKPDIVAPGVNIISTVPNFYTNPDHSDYGGWENAYLAASGTSMAAPMIAGIAALMMQRFPGADPYEIKARMMNTAQMEYLEHGDYSVHVVGAGFVDPIAAITQTSFATVETYIPWLGTGTGWSPSGNMETWRREALSSLNFGAVTDMYTKQSATLIVEFSDNRHWDVEIVYNASGLSILPADRILFYERTAEGISFTLQFSYEDELNRFYEGLVTFTSGDYRIVMPFAGFFGDGNPAPQVRPATGIIRPLLTSRDEPESVGVPLHTSFSAAVIGFNEPLGVALPFRFLAFPVYGEAYDAGHAFYYGTITLPANTDVLVPRAASVWGYNLATGLEETLLEGVYELRIEALDNANLVIETFVVGRFVISNEAPTIEIHHHNYYAPDDPNYPNVHAVVYSQGQDIIRVHGQVHSTGHELAVAHNVRTALHLNDDGSQMIYGYQFAMIRFYELGWGVFANLDGSFTMHVPYSRLAPFTIFGDAWMTSNNVMEGVSQDFIRIPVGTIGNFELWTTIGGLRSEYVTIIYMLEEELMALRWDDSTLTVGLDRFTPTLDTDAFEFELVHEDGTSQFLVPKGFTLNEQLANINFDFPITATGQAPLNNVAVDIPAPVAGETPVTTIADNGHYVGTVSWYPLHNVFHFGTEYIATITLWASGGSPFNQSTQVNIDAPDGMAQDIYVREDGLSMTIQVIFDETETLEEGYALVVLRISDPLGNNSGPFGNFMDHALFLDSSATMVPLVERIVSGAQPMPDDFWQMWDLQLPYYFWQNPRGGIVTGEASLLLPSGVYDWLWASARLRNTLGFDSILLEPGNVYVFEIDVDFNEMVITLLQTVYTKNEVAHVSSATSRIPLLSNQGEAGIVTFRGLMPNTDVGVFLGNERVTAPWATTEVHVHGSPNRYDVTINFPANTTGSPIMYTVRMSDGDGGWFDIGQEMVVSDQFIERPGPVTVVVDIRDPNPNEMFQFLIDSTATANGSRDYDEYDIFLPYFLEDNRHAVLVQGEYTTQLPAGVYDFLVANYWANRILESTAFVNVPLIYGHEYRFVVENWARAYRLWVDGVIAPVGRVPLDIPLPVTGEPLALSIPNHEAFSINIEWSHDHITAEADTLYYADVTLTAIPGMFLGGITGIAVTDRVPPPVTTLTQIRNLVIESDTVTFRVYFPTTDLAEEPGMVRLTFIAPESSIFQAAHRLAGYIVALDSTAQAFPLPPSAISPATGHPYFSAVRNLNLYDKFLPADPLANNFIRNGTSRSIMVEPGVIYDLAILGRGVENIWAGATSFGDGAAWNHLSPLYGMLDNIMFEYGYRYEITISIATGFPLITRRFCLQTGLQVPWDTTPLPQPPPVGQPTPTTITITPSQAEILPGEYTDFTAAVLNQHGHAMTGYAVIWSVSGNSSAGTTINQQGRLTVDASENIGTITVRADLDHATINIHGTAAVTVVSAAQPTPTTAVVNPSQAQRVPGSYIDFVATVYDQHGDAMTGIQLVWSIAGQDSSNTSISQNGRLTVGLDETIDNVITVTASVYENPAVYDTANVTIYEPSTAPATITFSVVGGQNFITNMFGIAGFQLMIDTTATAFPMSSVTYHTVRNDSLYDRIYPGGGTFIGLGTTDINNPETFTVTLPAGVYDIAFVAVGPGGINPTHPQLDTIAPGGMLYGAFNNVVLEAGVNYVMSINTLSGIFAWNPAPVYEPPVASPATITFSVVGGPNFITNMFGIAGFQLMIDTTASVFPMSPVTYHTVRNDSLYDRIYPGGGAFIGLGTTDINNPETFTVTLPAGVYDIAFVAVGPGGINPTHPQLDTIAPGGMLYGAFDNVVLEAGVNYVMSINTLSGIFAWNPVPAMQPVWWSADLYPLAYIIEQLYAVDEKLYEDADEYETVHDIINFAPVAAGIGAALNFNNALAIILESDYETSAVRPEYIPCDRGFTFLRLGEVQTTSVALETNDAAHTGARLYVTLHGKTLCVELNISKVTPTNVAGFNIFNNGPGGTQYPRPNPGLAAAGTIRMWTQINGVNAPVYLAAADTFAALDQNGQCAMEFVRVNRMWVAGTGWANYFNIVDVSKNNGSWQYINLSITAFGQTVHVLLVNALFEPPVLPAFGWNIFNNGPGGTQYPRPNPGLAAAGTIRMWTQLDGVNAPVYLAAADTIAALDQNGQCAMEFVRVNRMWVAGTGWIDYFNMVDVSKNNGSWQYINLYITVYGQTMHVLLVNALFEATPLVPQIVSVSPNPAAVEQGGVVELIVTTQGMPDGAWVDLNVAWRPGLSIVGGPRFYIVDNQATITIAAAENARLGRDGFAVAARTAGDWGSIVIIDSYAIVIEVM